LYQARQKKDFTTWKKQRWLPLLKVDPTDLIAEGDLGFEGKPIADVDLDRMRNHEAGIAEQHRASIWLIGEEPDHWNTPADT